MPLPAPRPSCTISSSGPPVLVSCWHLFLVFYDMSMGQKIWTQQETVLGRSSSRAPSSRSQIISQVKVHDMYGCNKGLMPAWKHEHIGNSLYIRTPMCGGTARTSSHLKSANARLSRHHRISLLLVKSVLSSSWIWKPNDVDTVLQNTL